ncbi:MAG: hypothetical protein LBI27_05065 [Clostridiales bacterium]|nr:hypothetical protein [Clostridiales bacterium]
MKYEVIKTAGKHFGLCANETESLANKAGLSLCADESFKKMFGDLLCEYPESKRRLCEMSLVSERMFRYIKEGRFLKKEPVLSLAISMGASFETIQTLLKKAGYVLSNSLPNDAVVMWILRNEIKKNPVYLANEILESLGLPLLMTGENRQ